MATLGGKGGEGSPLPLDAEQVCSVDCGGVTVGLNSWNS